jgi:hypothetical protein
MKVSILQTRNTPADRDIDYLVRHLEQLRVPVTLVDADSREGAALTELYDALERPAVLVTDDAGGLVEKWQGPQLPLAQDVNAAYGTQR